MSTQPLTEVEQAAARVLAERHNASSTTSRLSVAAFEGEARAVVAAVRPILEADTLDRFADHLRALVATESFCDEAADSGMKLAASVAEDEADTFRQSLPRPTSEEH